MLRKFGTTALAAVSLAGGTLALAPATGLAQSPTSFNCDATAVQATLLVAPSQSIGTANLGAPTCVNADGTGASVPAGLGLPVGASALTALTSVAPDRSQATAIANVAGLNVGAGGSLLAAVTGPISTAITGALAQNPLASVPLSVSSVPGLSTLEALPAPVGPAVTAAATISGPAGQAALQQTVLNAITNALNGQLVGLQAAGSVAGAKCVDGQPQLTGSSSLAGLSVLGRNIPLDGTVNPAISLLNTSQLSSTDIGAIVAQEGNAIAAAIAAAVPAAAQATSAFTQVTAAIGAAVSASLTPALQQALSQLQPVINQLVSLTVQPDRQFVTNGQLTQQALHLSLSIAGQNIIDTVLGQARVSDDSVSCVQVAAAMQALQCTSRRLTLIDVLRHGSRVSLLGAADRSLIGQRVSIYYLVGNKRVASAVVGQDGFFRTTAPLPPASQRNTNLARYQARDSKGERSLDLKLVRRMVVSSILRHGSKVTIKGRVIKPLATPVATILIQRRVSCTKMVTATRVRPNAAGYFTAVVAAPPGQQAATYRAATKVRKVAASRKLFPTFTLPRQVALS